MSPRSDELLAEAHERIAAARDAMASNHLSSSVSDAYYAMLYAIRAALSEQDLHAKTHSGAWGLFHTRFVREGHFDRQLHAEAHAIQADREGVDYGAERVERDDGERILALAERFVEAVDAMLTGS